MGQEAAYFRSHHAKSAGLTKMNGQSCERLDIQSETYLLIGCFEPMTGHPVALGLKIGEHVYAFNYIEYDTNAEPPPGAFEKPANVKFTDKPHSGKTNAAQ